jgi:hypothetical protein
LAVIVNVPLVVPLTVARSSVPVEIVRVPWLTTDVADEPADVEVTTDGEMADDGDDPAGEVAELDVTAALGAPGAVAPADPEVDGTSPA